MLFGTRRLADPARLDGLDPAFFRNVLPQVPRVEPRSAFFSRDGTDPRFWQGFDHAKLDEMPLELRKAYLATAPHPEQLPSFFAKSVQRMREFKGWTPAQIPTIRAPTLLIVGDRDSVRVGH